ncbi:alpha mannosidase-like protein [Serendipita sp. 400]|nr:alpha mannosidase-like protein [Serendipita sp. 400]
MSSIHLQAQTLTSFSPPKDIYSHSIIRIYVLCQRRDDSLESMKTSRAPFMMPTRIDQPLRSHPCAMVLETVLITTMRVHWLDFPLLEMRPRMIWNGLRHTEHAKSQAMTPSYELLLLRVAKTVLMGILKSYDVLLSRQGQKVEEDQDISSLSKKLKPWKGGVLVNEVMGLRVQMRNRFDGKGYDITKIGHLNVRQGEKVFFNDSLLFGERPADKQKANLAPRAKTVPIKFFTVSPEDPSMIGDDSRVTSEFIVEANTAEFGVDLDQLREDQVGAAGTFGLTGSHLVRVPDNANGCQPYHDPNGLLHNTVVFIERGECLFIEKLFNARNSGAAGVVVWHDSEEAVNPVVEAGDLAVFGAGIEGAAMVVIPASAAAFVVGRLILQEQDPRKHKVMVKVEKEWPEQLLGQDPQLVQAPTKTEKASGKILYINGNAMINTELLF